MQFIERKITSEVTTLGENAVGDSRLASQASFNSDGRIVLRNYSPYGKEHDYVIVFTKSETIAIIDLMIQMKNLKCSDLPF